MKIRTNLLRAFAAASAIGLTALAGCGGSSRTPIAEEEVAFEAQLPENDANVRGASAASQFKLVARSLTDGSVIRIPYKNGKFAYNLSAKHDWQLSFARSAGTGAAKIIPLTFGGGSLKALLLSRMKYSSLHTRQASHVPSMGLGPVIVSPVVDTVGLVLSRVNPLVDPILNPAIRWGNDLTWATFSVQNVALINGINSLASNAIALTAQQEAGISVGTCSAAAGTVSGITPNPGVIGQTVTIAGTGFSGNYTVAVLGSDGSPIAGFDTAGTGSAKSDLCTDTSFTGVAATTATGGTSLTFTVPTTAVTGASGSVVLYQAGAKPITTGLALSITSDTTAPTIVSLNPTAGGSHNATITTASVTFSEAMTTSTTPDVTVALTNTTTGTTTVLSGTAASSIGSFSWSTDSKTLTFTLTDTRRLNDSATYQLALTFGTGANGLKDAAGNALSLTNAASLGSGITLSGQTVTYTFSTADTTAPTIATLSPAAGGSHNAQITTASVTFSEAMNTTTTPDVTVTLLNPSTGTQVTVLNGVAATTIGSVAWSTDSKTLTFTLTDATRNLTAGTSYQLRLTFGTGTNALKDTTGNALSLTGANALGSGITVSGQSVTYTFTTTADSTAPTIVSLSPTAGASQNAAITTASVTFSEPMLVSNTTPDVTVTLLNPSTGTQTTVVGGTAAPSLGTVSWSTDRKTLTFTLTDARRLTASTSYQLTLTFGTGTTALKDESGNNLSLTNAASLGSNITLNGNAVSYTFSTI